MKIEPSHLSRRFIQLQNLFTMSQTSRSQAGFFHTQFRQLQDLIGLPSGSQTNHRRSRRRRCGFGQAIESVEERLCLSAAIPTLDVATPTLTTQAGAEGSLYYRLGNQQNASSMHGLGGVALEGGGNDVDQAFQWMIGRMGGKGDFLVLLSTNDPGYDSYIYNFGGTNSVSTLVIPNRAAAIDPAVQKIILSADAIFIGGGSQNEYLDWWKGTPVQQAIGTDIARGVPIGGTSAGTDVLTQFIYSAELNSIHSTQAMADPFDPNMTFDENFVSSNLLPFLKNTIVDTHFENRDRLGRMTAFLARVDSNGWSSNRRPMGIGINQSTALLIAPNGLAQVVANADASLPGVDFFETPGQPQVDRPGQSLTYTSILEDHVAAGGTFNLSNWNASFPVINSLTTHYNVSVKKGVLTQTQLSAPTSPATTSQATSSPLQTTYQSLSGAAKVTTVPAFVPLLPVSNTSFAPTSFTDSYASVPGSVVSLRDAVIAANNSSATGTVTINLKSGTYSLSLPQGGQEDGTNGDLIVSNTQHTLVINGKGTSGSGATMIDASLLSDRIFQILPGATVVLNNLILTGGVAKDDGSYQTGPARGGAILDNGQSLTLNNVWVVGNEAKGATGEDAQGGGIYSGGGNLALYRSTVATNKAEGGSGSSSGGNGGNGQGGGIFASTGSVILGTAANPDKIASNYAVGGTGGSAATGGNGGNAQGGGLFVGGGSLNLSLNMSHAVFSSNFAQAGSGGSGSTGSGGSGGIAQGAGLYCYGSAFLSVNSDHDSFQSNRASGGGASTGVSAGAAQGAGIYLNHGVLNLAHDSFSSDIALGGAGGGGGAAQGGAVYFQGLSTPSTIASSNFSANVALGGASLTSDMSGGAGQGGGLYANDPSENGAKFNLSNNTFDSNSARGGSGADVADTSTGGTGGGAAGGGLYVNGFSIILSSVGDRFLSNVAVGGRGGNGGTGGSGGTGQGGGVYVDIPQAGVAGARPATAPTLNAGSILLTSDQIRGNSVTGGTGGQATAGGQGGVGGEGDGGGLFLNRESTLSPVTLTYDALTGNKAQGGFGGGVFSGGIGGAGGAGLGGGLYVSHLQPPLKTDYTMCNSVTGGSGGLASTKGSTGATGGSNVYFIATAIPTALHISKPKSNDTAGA